MLRHHFPRGFALRSRLALPIRCSLSMPAMPQTDIGLGIPDALPEWKKMPTMEDCVGETPLVRLQRMVPRDSKSMVLCKLEGLNCFALFLKDLPDSLNRLYIQIFKASLLFQRKTVKNLVRGNCSLQLAVADMQPHIQDIKPSVSISYLSDHVNSMILKNCIICLLQMYYILIYRLVWLLSWF